MSKKLVLVLFCGLAITLACDDDAPPATGVDPTADDLADCTCPNFESFAGAFVASANLRVAVEDPQNLPSSVNAYSSTTGEFSVSIDLNDDGVSDGSFNGTIRNPRNYDDGIQINEALVAEWDLVYGNITGTGIFSTVRLAASSYRLTIVEVNPTFSGGACGFELTSLGLHYDESLVTRGPWGTIEFKTTMGTKEMAGLMTVVQDSDLVSVSANYNGQSVEFQIDTDTFQVVR